MVLTASFFSWEFAPQVFVGMSIIAIGLWTTFTCEVDHIGVIEGQVWKNHFSDLKVTITHVSNGDRTGGTKMVSFILEGENLVRTVPKSIFLTQYKRITIR